MPRLTISVFSSTTFLLSWLQPGNALVNYNQWVTYIADTSSADDKIFVGVPAAPLAANGGTSGERYCIVPDQLAFRIGQYKSNLAFGGVMM